MTVSSTWSRLQAEQTAAEKAAAAKPKPPRVAKRPSGQLKTIDQLAELLQVSRSTIYRLIEVKALPAIRIGFVLRFDVDEVMTWARAFTASGDKLGREDPPPSHQRGPTLMAPRRAVAPVAPAPERSAEAKRRAELRCRRLASPDLLEGSNDEA